MSDIAPGFLIAVPQLADPNFERSLVLMLEHGESGAMGLVINRPGPLTMADVAGRHGVKRPALQAAPVFVGGPVEPERGFVLHDRDDLPEAVRIFGGLHVSGSIESLKTLFEEDPKRFRLCLGYAGWGPGQLEQELKDGSWLTAEVSVEHVLRTAHDDCWEAVLKDMGIDPAMLMQGRGEIQ